MCLCVCFFFFFQAEDGIRDLTVTGVQTCALDAARRWDLRIYGCNECDSHGATPWPKIRKTTHVAPQATRAILPVCLERATTRPSIEEGCHLDIARGCIVRNPAAP